MLSLRVISRAQKAQFLGGHFQRITTGFGLSSADQPPDSNNESNDSKVDTSSNKKSNDEETDVNVEKVLKDVINAKPIQHGITVGMTSRPSKLRKSETHIFQEKLSAAAENVSRRYGKQGPSIAQELKQSYLRVQKQNMQESRNAKQQSTEKPKKLSISEQLMAEYKKPQAESMQADKSRKYFEQRVSPYYEQRVSPSYEQKREPMKEPVELKPEMADKQDPQEVTPKPISHMRSLMNAYAKQQRQSSHQKEQRNDKSKKLPPIYLSLYDEISNHSPLFQFSDAQESPPAPKLKTWDMLERKHLEDEISRAPSNIYEEMIQWTLEGKLWKFPIDNEQGLEKEQSVHFSNHVFLEKHLKDWCPNKGPLRHFMELVCVGLSKNPYMTVEEKINHIKWYKEYFEEKQSLLDEPAPDPVDAQDMKQEATA